MPADKGAAGCSLPLRRADDSAALADVGLMAEAEEHGTPMIGHYTSADLLLANQMHVGDRNTIDAFKRVAQDEEFRATSRLS
eukprot:gene18405-5339_t